MLYLHLASSLDVQHSNPSDPVPQMEELEEMVSKALKTAENSSWAKLVCWIVQTEHNYCIHH